MKVCLAGHFGDVLDEGVRNVGKSLATGLDHTGIELKKLAISSFFEWKSIRAFRPDIIHFILTPTATGVVTAKLIASLYPEAKTVISAIHPSVPRSRLLKPFKPDLTLIQAKESELLFKSIGFHTRFFANGVDIKKFQPIDYEKKQRLRAKFGIPEQSFVVLHLASMKRDRNLDIFKKIQMQEGVQVLIVGREGEAMDTGLLLELQEAGCLVWIKHFSHVEEIYQISDCYIFPTIQKNACIETPLSVLEAMACNLPVVTTKFGALPSMFSEGAGLFFTKDAETVPQVLQETKNTRLTIDTRNKVSLFSWDLLAETLVTIYDELLC
jgi:glycosyltransferase involved in cell wall biosynthesis